MVGDADEDYEAQTARLSIPGYEFGRPADCTARLGLPRRPPRGGDEGGSRKVKECQRR